MTTDLAQKLYIFNLACIKSGNEGISDINENTDQAWACRRVYDMVKTSLLNSHEWKFATGEAALELVEEKPTRKFRYWYHAPQDFVKAQRVYSEQASDYLRFKQAPFDMQSMEYNGDNIRVIRTTAKNAVLVYTRDIAENLFPGLFTDALSYRLAAEIVRATRQDMQLHNYLLQNSVSYLELAMKQDTEEEAAQGFIPRFDRYIMARKGGGREASGDE